MLEMGRLARAQMLVATAATIIATPNLPTITPGPTNSIMISTTAHEVPEIGMSLATSAQANILKMAREIVELMEKPW